MRKMDVFGWGVLLVMVLTTPAFSFDGVDIPEVRRLAEMGNPDAQSKLGVLNASGVGMEVNKKEAVKWYGKAAGQGYPLGQWNLAFMYLRGEGGLQEDYAKARELFQQAADQGFAPAQYDLGMMYYHGVAVESNRDEAEKWFRRAAGQGYREAKKKLAELNKQ